MTLHNLWLRRLLWILCAGILSGCSTSSRSSFDTLHHATVLVEHAKGHGTGAIIGTNAVLTADHVVGTEPLSVTFFDGRVAQGRVRWRDPILDVALVEVAVPEDYPASKLYCGDLEPGQHLLLIGHPTQSRWVAVGGYLPATGAFEGNLISLGFPIGLGTSGGPVFDAGGRIVGVALAILAERASATARFDEFKDTGIGLMLPANQFCSELEVLQSLRAADRR
jgi:S1-C subfamily serine protease